MEGLNLYFDVKTNEYLYVGVPVCSNCKKEILDNVIIYTGISRVKSYIKEFCYPCFRNFKDNYSEITEIKTALIVEKPTLNSHIVIIRPPSLSNFTSNTTVFEASSIEFDKIRGDHNVIINDKTLITNKNNNKLLRGDNS